MATTTLVPYLSKLKSSNVVNVSLPQEHELGQWDDDQGQMRMRHLANAIDVPPGANGVHSIPNPWARPILFRRALLDPEHALHGKILGEWRGMLALLALKEVRHLSELNVRAIQLNERTADPESFHYAVARVLPENQDALDPNAGWGSFHLITWAGDKDASESRAFAMTSPWTLVATGADYANVLSWTEVSWFEDGLLKDPCDQLSRQEKTALAEWLWKIDAGLPTVSGAKTGKIGELLLAFARDLDASVTGKLSIDAILSNDRLGLSNIPLYAQIDRPIRPTVRVLSDCAIVTDRPQAPLYALIDSAVSDTLRAADQTITDRDISAWKMVMLADVHKSIPALDQTSSGIFPRESNEAALNWCTRDFFFESKLIYEQMRPRGGDDAQAFPGCRTIRAKEGSRSEGRHIVLPIRQKVLELFTPDYLENNLSVEWIAGGDNAGAACFRLCLEVQSISPDGKPQTGSRPKQLVIEHTYSLEDMVRVAALPVVCLWPNFSFDDDPAPGATAAKGQTPVGNRWALYYLFESWRAFGGRSDEFVVTPIGAQESPNQRKSSMPVYLETGKQQGEESFQITVLTRFPEALSCSTTPVGGQQFPKHEDTVSGLLLLKSTRQQDLFQGQAEIVGVDFGTTGTSIYHAVNQTNQNDGAISRMGFASRLLPITSTDSGEFQRISRDLFLPNTGPAESRILSIFQDFGANGTRSAVRDGHVLFMEDSSARGFVQGNPKGILTNLKWSEDKAVNKASQDFLEQLCLQALAEAVSAGANRVELRYSYPTAFSQDDLSNFVGLWNGVWAKLKRITSVPIELHQNVQDNCESIAAARFFSHPVNQARMVAGRGAISLDIGGGTTDIAVWNRDPNSGRPALLAHTSVKFAGQDIFLDPLRKKPGLLSEIDDGGDVTAAIKLLDSRLAPGSSAYFAEVDAIVAAHSSDLLVNLPACAQSKGIKEFLQILDLGLRGIAFYTGLLVGRLVKDEIYDDRLPRIPVFIGGNGSRLFQWCAQGYADNNSTIVRRFAQDLLAAANFASGGKLKDKLIEVSLSEKPKEEVAFGLVMRPVNMERNDNYIAPVAGEYYLVGMRQDRKQRSWDTAPDLQTLGTQPVLVDPELTVFKAFLASVGIRLSEDELCNIASAVDQEIANMANRAVQALSMQSLGGQPQDPVRRQPLFILALQYLLSVEVKNLVAIQLGLAKTRNVLR